MASDQQSKHKPGPLKQQNKAHKHGQHRTKGELQKSFKGRVDVKGISKKNKQLDRQQRRHQAKQLRKNKRNEVIEQKRQLGTDHAPPHVIALFTLSPLCNCEEAIENIVNSDDTIESFVKNNIRTIVSTKHRQRFTVICPPMGDLFSILDAAKVADSFLFLLPASGELDEFSKRCLTCLIAHGLPSSIHAIQGLKHVPMKKQNDTKKSLSKQLEKWFPEIRLQPIDSGQEAGVILRLLANQKQKRILYRERRPYLLADQMENIVEDSVVEDGKCTLKISGYVRGKALNVNQLVHLPGAGEFQMAEIGISKDPYSLKKRRVAEDSIEMEEEEKVVIKCDPSKQASLITEAEVDPMESEQTWPTEDELREADEAAALLEKDEVFGGEKQLKKKPPKGMSEYQAAWIVDEDEEDDDINSDDDDDDDDSMCSEDGEMDAACSDEEDCIDDSISQEDGYDTQSVSATTIAHDDENYDKHVHFDMEEEQRELEKYRLEHENNMFPDEVDTPQHIPACERFQRYRGLKSFRTSPWDPKENLPLDYARIFQFQDFNRAKRRVMKEYAKKVPEEDAAQVGSYVTIHVSNVPKVFLENWKPSQPLSVFGLLPNEQKMSVMHYTVKRHASFDAPVKAKERLIFHVGYRRFSSSTLFSQHTTGNKFKAERFLPHDGVTVATVYAPIFFPPSPVLVFTEDHQLIATGTVLNSNPDRVVVKKIVLSGHPFKIHKKSSVVRYMFFNRDDILWFKPVELFTKYGRRGNIKVPLGTHGHMKCVFDGQLKAQDTVCMNLFKRVFPKWTYDPCVSIPTTITFEDSTESTDVNM